MSTSLSTPESSTIFLPRRPPNALLSALGRYIGGEAGLGSPYIDGVFLDDGWGAGPSEVESHSVADMGLSKEQVAHIAGNWSQTCAAVSAKLAEMKGL